MSLEIDDRVQFAAKWLRSIHLFHGPEAPTSVGPFARGHVVRIDPFDDFPNRIFVEWDNGVTTTVLESNLEVAR